MIGRAFRNRGIAVGFALWTWWRRVMRVLGSLGRDRLVTLDHITIPVRDLERARRFYCEVLGAAHLMTIDEEALKKFSRPPAPNDGDGVFHVSLFMGGETRIDLFQQRAGQAALTQPHPHVAFRVSPRQLTRWKEHLERLGIPTEGPLQLGPPGQASLYFNDPSGNHLELTCMGFTAPIPIEPPHLERLAWTPSDRQV